MGASPTRQPLQPEAIGAVMEVTKWLKPSISVSRSQWCINLQGDGPVGHKSSDTLRGYVSDAELFKDRAGVGLLYVTLEDRHT